MKLYITKIVLFYFMKINYDPFKRKNSGGIRAAVLGMNDGLVSNFCLVMGVSGGIADTANTNIILLLGMQP